ncbi:MAG: hypothetical protein NTX87_10425 [Planctomycetota bacterium]|nr:hypothetical protein [Planctomycetota bacterium]
MAKHVFFRVNSLHPGALDMPAKIAILGWGSLLWEGGEEFDRWREPWQYDGPSLKLEFSRVSDSRLGALTLVIDPKHGSPTTVRWCLSKRQDPDDAVCDLRCREGTTLAKIGRILLGSSRNQFRDQESHEAIAAWAKTKNLDGIIWTDLRSNFQEKVKQTFSVQAAVSYVKALPAEARAKAAEYVWRAPDVVQTPLRMALQKEPWFSAPRS